MIVVNLFVEVVLHYLNLVPFQLIPNSLCTIVAFYIAYVEAIIGATTVKEFSYVYCIKTLANHEGLWYTSKRRLDVEGVWGVHENMGNYKDRFFFYPLKRPGEFRIVSE